MSIAAVECIRGDRWISFQCSVLKVWKFGLTNPGEESKPMDNPIFKWYELDLYSEKQKGDRRPNG